MDNDIEGTSLNLTHLVLPSRARGTAGESTPGLLLLHGRGADEEDLMGLAGALDPRLTVVSARAPFRMGPGFAWYGMAQVGEPDQNTLLISVNELHDFIGGMTGAYNIDPQRLYLMGFSQGAVMSSAVALTMPDAVRGLVMHSGYVPIDAGLDLKPEKVRGMPVFIAHGIYDDVIPISFGRAARDYMTAAGARLTYREYPIGHSISEESFYDLAEWLTNELDT